MYVNIQKKNCYSISYFYKCRALYTAPNIVTFISSKVIPPLNYSKKRKYNHFNRTNAWN